MMPRNLFSLAAFFILIGGCAVLVSGNARNPVDFRQEDAKPKSNLVDFQFVNRFMLPYGPDLYGRDPPQRPDEHPYAGYGYGMGALEELAYDSTNHYIYGGSDQGYVIVVDFQDPRNPMVTDFSFNTTVESLTICEEHKWLIVNDGEGIHFYETVQRSNPQTPRFLKDIPIQGKPRRVLPNRDCTLLAIVTENSGDELDEGSLSIVRNITSEEPDITFIPLDPDNQWDDDYMLRKGLHMPLTKSALEYWDDLQNPEAADGINFSLVRNNYKSAIFIEPKKVAWNGPDETELLINLQENNGLIRVNMATNKAVSAASYGLKDHNLVPVDINKADKNCNLRTYANLFAMKNPDTIATLRYNDRLYVVTANEGDYKKYAGWKDYIKAKELFDNHTFGLPHFEVDRSIFDPSNTSTGHSALFNSVCEGPDCVRDTVLSVGSNAIDFESDVTNPIFYRMVLFGGRGWSIYELPTNPDALLKLVFDSGDAIEKSTCEHFPWSHNAAFDEEVGPAANYSNNTLWQIADEELKEILTMNNDPLQDGCDDQGDGTPGACPLSKVVDSDSAKNGAGVEEIVLGVACGRLITAFATEKSSVGLLFDITEITSPELKKVFHLSPANQNKSAGLAYNDGDIGEIDPETVIFLSEDESPTGKAGIIFGGAYSGTISWWEFECMEDSENRNLRQSNGSRIWNLGFISSLMSGLAMMSLMIC